MHILHIAIYAGQYASVGDIHFSNESFIIQASWNRPHHLVGVPPTGYNCTVLILSTGDYLDTTVNVENSSCSFELEENLTCAVLVMEVVAYNQWLGGDVETTFWSLGGECIVSKGMLDWESSLHH